MTTTPGTKYQLEGRLLEVCSCDVLCPCWVGRDPDGVDDKATQEQQDALLSAFTGKLGGPIADTASLIGEVVGVERAPITFTVEGGKGTLAIGQTVQAEMAPFTGPTGEATTLHESIFSTIPGSPAYVSNADYYRSKVPALGHDVNLQNHNAIQGTFRFTA